jgi:vancomycin resistance protein YoaR
VIAPGETYSRNEGTGRRTRARGLRVVENGCIGSGGEPVDCLGGGVSQMGTTFLGAAWKAGIELVEFRQHSLYVPRYPVCREATLNWGSLDVVVRNNSPHDITIDAFYDDEILGVRFLSRPWAQVESWAQPQDPPSSGPFDSSCGRTITYPDGRIEQESWSWRYQGVGF